MPKTSQFMLVIIGFMLFVLLFALFPAMLQADLRDGTLQFHWANGIASIRHYLRGIFSGESFYFLAGRTEHSFWEQIGAYFKVSFCYTAIGGVAGLTGGILLGVYFAISRSRWMKSVLELTSILPDFVIVLLLQFLIVYLASKTGIAVFKVASVSTDDPAIALPLFSTILIPTNYMIRNVALQMNNAFTEDYITFARARGLSKSFIVFFHALPNVLPFIKADLHKFMGILFGNLFIFEYLYNLNGVTLLVFSNAFDYSGYQYSFVVNGLFTLLVLYAIVYALLRAVIFGWEKVIVR